MMNFSTFCYNYSSGRVSSLYTTAGDKRERCVLYSVKGWGIPGLCHMVHLSCHEHVISTLECLWHLWQSVVEAGPVILHSSYSYFTQFIPATYSHYIVISQGILVVHSHWNCTSMIWTPCHYLQPMKQQSKLKQGVSSSGKEIHW